MSYLMDKNRDIGASSTGDEKIKGRHDRFCQQPMEVQMETAESDAEMEFDGAVLRQLRRRRRWSQEKLAAEARISERSVQRYERGKQVPEDRTLRALATALGVPPEKLQGQAAAEPNEEEIPLGKQAFSKRLQIRNDCMNALALVAMTYSVTPAHIVEAAPLLFDMVARGSLRRRRERLDAVNEAIGTVESAAEDFPHLPPSGFAKWYEALDVEEASITRGDIFARDVDDAPIHRSGSDKYHYGTDNPLAIHLREMVETTGPEVEFRSWPPYDGPHYTVCKEKALEYMGGDEDAAAAILSGHAPINLMTKAIGSNAGPADRATWAKAEAERFKVERVRLLAGLDLDLDLLLAQATETAPTDGEEQQ